MWLKLHINFLRWLLKRRYGQKIILCNTKDIDSFTLVEVACLQEELRNIRHVLCILEKIHKNLR